jgi:hypothetical protein
LPWKRVKLADAGIAFRLNPIPAFIFIPADRKVPNISSSFAASTLLVHPSHLELDLPLIFESLDEIALFQYNLTAGRADVVDSKPLAPFWRKTSQPSGFVLTSLFATECDRDS